MEKKTCTICNEVKPRTEFTKDKSRSDGLSSRCKCCSKIKNKKRAEKHKIKIVERNKLNEQKVIDEFLGKTFRSFKITEYLGKYSKDTSGYIRFFFKKECTFCGATTELNLTNLKNLIKKNSKCNLCKETINIHTKQRKCPCCKTWLDATSKNFPFSKNKPFGIHYHCLNCHRFIHRKRRESKEVRDKEYLQKKERLKTDPLFKFIINVRAAVSIPIKQKGYSKKTKTFKILGCDKETFINYIQSKWENWMTWENHGKYNGEFNYGWDLDHIIPVSSATNYEEVIKLNHYTNFQPLCSYINRAVKRDSLNWNADSPQTRPPF